VACRQVPAVTSRAPQLVGCRSVRRPILSRTRTHTQRGRSRHASTVWLGALPELHVQDSECAVMSGRWVGCKRRARPAAFCPGSLADHGCCGADGPRVHRKQPILGAVFSDRLAEVQ
jgi:hypothetical protein